MSAAPLGLVARGETVGIEQCDVLSKSHKSLTRLHAPPLTSKLPPVELGSTESGNRIAADCERRLSYQLGPRLAE